MKHAIPLAIALCAAGPVLSAFELRTPTAPFVKKTDSKAESTRTEFRNEGIYKGNKSLIWVNGQPHASLVFRKDSITLFELHCRVSPSDPGWAPFVRFQDKPEPEKKTMTRTLDFHLNQNDAGKFIQKITLNPNGLIDIELTYDCDQSKIRSKTFNPFIPLHSIAGRKIRINGKEIVLPNKAEWSLKDGRHDPWIHGGWFPKVGKIEFFPDSAEDSFQLDLNGKADVVLFRALKGAHFSIRPREKTEKTFRFTLNPGQGSRPSSGDNVVNGINFTQNNAFTVSLFDEKRNFLVNPSFESGARYFLVRNADLKTWITDKEARSGKYSCLLRGSIGSFSFPIRQRKDYTLSFYAKSSGGTPRSLSLFYRSYENTKETQRTLSFSVTGNEWKRFEIPFNIPRSAIRFFFRGDHVYLDDIQLEPGKKATPYAGNKIGLEIRTDSPEHDVVNAEKKINARLLVRGPAETRGKIRLTVSDFFKRITVQKEVPFTIPQSGETILPVADDSAFPLGTNIIRADVAPEGLPAYTDFLRVTRMKYADNTAKNKNIHGTAYYGYNYLKFNPPAKEMNLLKIGGIGAHSYLSNHKTPEVFAILKKYGMDTFGSYIERGDFDYKKRKWHAPINDAIRKVSGVQTARELKTFPPEVLKAVENAAFEITKKYPHVLYWTAHTEPSGHYLSIRSGNMMEYAKYILAINRGILRANPNAVFNPMGDCGMGKGGRENVLKFLKCCNELEPQVRFKNIDIHTYRQFPEQADTEFDLKAFMDGLAKVGYKDIPIHLGEGAYWVPIIVNEWLGIAPWQDTTTKDRYGMHLPSYDLGWGEQVSAAMILRHWLIAYKYMDRVKFTCPWMEPFLDDTLPFAWLCMSSNLTDLLGNSVFKRDIRFTPGARAYLFEDERGRPVAAYWYFEEELDRGLKNGLRMKLDLKKMDPEFIDIMGNRCSAKKENGMTILPLSNFPVFIRGRKGEMEPLANAILNARIPNAGKPPVELISTGVAGSQQLRFDVVNQLSRPLKLSLKAGSDPERALNLASNERKPMTCRLKEPLRFDRVNKIGIPVTVRCDGQTVKSQFELAILPLKKVSGAIDWTKIPSIRLPYIMMEQYAKTNHLKWNGPADLSGSCQAAWSSKGLYFRFDIRDNEFVMDHSDTKRGVESWYDNDTIQLFIDSLGDGRANAKRGNSNFDLNDYSYELLPTGKNSAIVYRRHAPDQQLTGGLDGLRPNTVEKAASCKFERKGDRMIYEVFLPARCLQPMDLAPGSMPGLGIKVFDRDGKDKCSKQVLSNVNGDVFRRTDIYTQLLLTK